MSGDPKLDKQTAAGTVPPPRMLGDTDVSLILSFAEKLPEGAHILEVGPWLGGLTVDLARYGHVTVVDRFLWTDVNARNYPGITEANTSFRSVFEANMAAQDLDVDVIESTLPDMLWEGGALDFIFIDAPRDAATLHGCLRAVAHAINPGARVLIKHALNMRYLDMGAYVDALVGMGLASIEATEQPDWCNIVAMTVDENFAELSEVKGAGDLIATAPMSSDFTDPWYGRRLSAYRLGFLARAGRSNAAYARLGEMPRNSQNLKWWDQVELQIHSENPEETNVDLAVLGELVWVHNDARPCNNLPVVPTTDFPARLAAYWRNNKGKKWACNCLEPKLLADSNSEPTFTKLTAYAEQLFRGRVLEIGRGLGPAALSSLIYGADHYYGIELDNLTELGAAIDARYPHITIAAAAEDNLPEIAQATVLIIGEEITADSAIADAIRTRMKAPQSEITIIR